MAVDTPQKRFSLINLTMPWRGTSVVPSGTVTAAERAAFIFLYSGIALSGAVTRVDDRTATGRVIIAFTTGDTFRMRVQRTSGSDDLQTVDEGSAITVEVIA